MRAKGNRNLGADMKCMRTAKYTRRDYNRNEDVERTKNETCIGQIFCFRHADRMQTDRLPKIFIIQRLPGQKTEDDFKRDIWTIDARTRTSVNSFESFRG